VNQRDLQLSSESEELNQTARIISVLIWAMLGGFLFVFFTGVYFKDWKLIAVTISGCVLLIMTMLFLKRQHIQSISLALALIMLSSLTAIATVGQGIRDLAVLGFPIVLIFSGLTINRKFFRLCVGFSLVAVGWLVIGENYRWFVTVPFEGEAANWYLLIGVSLILLIGALAVDLLATNMRRNLDKAKLEIAERKRVEEALRESKAITISILESTSDLIWSVDPEKHGLQIYNRGLKDYFSKQRGLDIQVGMGPEDLFPPGNYVQQWHEYYQRALREGTYSTEYTAFERSVTLQLTFNLLEHDNQVFGISVFGKDISEQKQVEERILQSEKKYRELFQVNKDGIAIFLINQFGPPSTFVEVNVAAHKMLGYTEEEMLKLTPVMLEANTSLEKMRSRHLDLISKGVVSYETVLNHKDGHHVFTEFTSQVIQYEGKPAIMNIVRDVTERNQREKELQAIASLSAALRNAPTRTEMLPVIVEQIVVLLNCETVSVEIIDPLTGDAVTEAAKGTWEALIGRHQKSGTGINAIISQSGQSYITNDLKHDSHLAYPEWTQNNIHGGAGVPLIAQNKLIGYLWMGRTTEIAESEVRLLSSVANIAANAIHRATLYEQTQIDTAELKKAYDTTLEGWVNALELRDQETEGHARNVVQMTSELALALGFPENELEHIRRGALLHDIGKMGIPDSVLLKPGTLNDREWEIMRRHPEYAYKLLEPIEYLRPVLDIPYCHHEKWDGSGYPRGLKGEEIPLSARVFAIVDVWDALMSDRPYRKAWSHEQSMKHIQGQAGKHFDPKVVAAFLAMMDGQIQSKTPSP
jgi:PAS domain S-box-containing protein